MKYLDYLDSNDTAYMEYHQWRNGSLPDEPEKVDMSQMNHTWQMLCNMCQVVQNRKRENYPKRIIESVASWWWVNVHDDLCTKDYAMPQWVKEIPAVTMENSYDELKVKLHSGSSEKPK